MDGKLATSGRDSPTPHQLPLIQNDQDGVLDQSEDRKPQNLAKHPLTIPNFIYRGPKVVTWRWIPL